MDKNYKQRASTRMKISQPTQKVCLEKEIYEPLLSLDNKKILELGCGKADITRQIATQGPGRLITATEVDQLQHQKNLLIDDLPNVSFLMAGSESISLDDELFDVVLMFKSFHHVPVELMAKALVEVKRVMKPGALLYISEPIFKGEFNEVLRLFHDEEKVRKAAFDTITQSVESNQFDLVEQIFFNAPVSFDSFEAFEQRIIQVTHTDHQLSPQLQQQVKNQFLKTAGPDGAQFQVPIRVDLLQRPV